MGKTEAKMDKIIYACLDEILNGTLLAIDPGSNSLGYAFFRKGKLGISGEIRSESSKDPAHKRIHEIADQLLELEAPKVLAIELIRKNTPLIWSVGATVACVRSPHLIEVPIPLWHMLREEDYEKTDELDAELIGRTVIERARLLKEFL